MGNNFVNTAGLWVNLERLLWEILLKNKNLLVGCVSSAAVAISGVGVSQRGVCPEESTYGGCLPREGCLPIGGVCLGVSTQGLSDRHSPVDRQPPVDRITDSCKNITLPQLHCGQ